MHSTEKKLNALLKYCGVNNKYVKPFISIIHEKVKKSI